MTALQRLWTVLFIAGALPASAETRPASVLNFTEDGIDRQIVGALNSIVKTSASASFQTTPLTVDIAELAFIQGCDPNALPCVQKVARTINSEVIIYGNLARQGKSLRLELVIFDSVAGKRISTLHKTAENDPVNTFRPEIEAFLAPTKTVAATLVNVQGIENTQLFIDGIPAGPLPFSREGLSPGTYSLRAEHPDFAPWEETLVLKEGEQARVHVTFQRRLASPIASKGTGPTTQDTVTTTNWAAWSTIGAGAAALASSGVFAWLVHDTQNTLESEVQTGITRARYNELVDRGESWELAHQVMLGVGAAAVVGGTIWLLVSPKSERQISLGIGPDQIMGTVRW